MCGIGGVVSSRAFAQAALDRMSEALIHRGPDGHGQWSDGGVALVHRRLSILDLEHGQQPMLSADGNLVVVFNGEIYNYPELRDALEAKGRVFLTRCDTEVLLHLYAEEGPEFVERLRGMFAFAILDRRERRLMLARDHMGQKPLFYFRSGSVFAFASEVKALLAAGIVRGALDVDALWDGLGLRFSPGETTLFGGVRKLCPGTLLLLDLGNGSVRTSRFWQLNYGHKTSMTFVEAADELERLAKETVESHLLSDVPLGSFLSGGVDSSLVSALAAASSGARFPTFTIAADDAEFSELDYAREAADTIGSDHHELTVHSDLMLLLPDIVWHLEQPADTHAVGFYHLSKFARSMVTVILSGDGGDETFGGYARFTRSRWVDAYRSLPAAIRAQAVSRILNLLPHSYGYYNLADKVRWAHQMSLVSGAERSCLALTFFGFSEAQRDRLLTPEASKMVANRDTTRWIRGAFREGMGWDDVDRELYVEQTTRMPEHFLQISDRMSMAHGLEVRAPLVDHRLTEFAATLPAAYKIRPGELKIILREVARRYFPARLIDRPKRGFKFPISRWFRGSFAPFVERAFSDLQLIEAGVFDAQFVRILVEEHLRGRADHGSRLWYLLNLEVWHRLFVSGQPRDDVRSWIDASIGKSHPPVREPWRPGRSRSARLARTSSR